MKEKRKVKLLRSEQEQLRSLILKMQDNPAGNYSIGLLSKSISINRNKLGYGFKQLTGYSIHQYVIKTRMENAKALLQKTDKPIKEIARINGYTNTKNFITAFKNYWKKTPYQVQQENGRA